jgi:hypothetical protein
MEVFLEKYSIRSGTSMQLCIQELCNNKFGKDVHIDRNATLECSSYCVYWLLLSWVDCISD